MENINVTMGIDDEAIEKLAQKVVGSIDIQDHIDMSEIIDNRIETYDFDGIIDQWIDYNLDFDSKVSNALPDALSDINFKDYIDTDDFEIDAESEARSLLENYSPLASCSTGQAFTGAIEDAIRYLLLKDNDFVAHIAKALERLEKKKMAEEIRESVIEELKPLMFDTFKADLERYAAHVEYEKAQQIITQTNAVVIPEVTPWTRENDIGY
jgi:hypothetical protein